MTEKTRGRASKVDLLPPKIKTTLTMMLRDKQFSQSKILEEINDIVRDAGLPDSYLLSRSGLNRYASRMERMGAKIRASREMAEVWTRQLGEMPKGDIGKMLLEFVKTMAYERAMDLDESGEYDAKTLNQFALIAQRVEQAEMLSYKREQAIRKEVAQEAADTAEQVVIEAGLSADTVKNIKQQILGIADDRSE